ncbi:MAG TPA: VOC family protein [Planosporangium sp.]|jgi:catechol 2,3-dioxygenase-like lactoylglutathione lyase family enzyme|nr:VOC family protein [Planosporangium sp.]
MTVLRVVPDIECSSLQSATSFYTDVLGLEVVMDLGWIVTLADPATPAAQVSLMTEDLTAPVVPDMSVEVDDVDRMYELAVRSGAEIIHPLTDEKWGVRRFFVRDPNGRVLNVLTHRGTPDGIAPAQ